MNCNFSLEMSWIRSGTEMSQFLRIFLPTLAFVVVLQYVWNEMQTYVKDLVLKERCFHHS